ncbi:sugar transferase [Roseovarius nanhaiticus]|uniref:sugar transferase n=1 Tax=Roseovarius nanhaiticus TaxID=573024 RepID=UPI002492CFE9|nr:sugar transferase [Roseovarius nanhaiticus]
MKRTFDIVMSALLLLIFSPIMIGTAIAVRLDSPGKALYTQTRVGRGLRPFRIYKFRSMVADADKIGGHSTHKGDARVTKVGRFIRKTSLDELPQLLNVLKGDMSLVGPRPDVPAQESQYEPYEWIKRHRVRPGITGLAQATLRSAAKPGERTRLDLEYVDTASVWRDIVILGQTARQVLGRGGY